MRKLLAALVLAASLTACSDAAAPAPDATDSGALSGDLVVLAASSLTETFDRIGKDFQTAHPGVHVTISYGGSSTLAQQVTSGAPADVFAAASPATMKVVTDDGLATGTPAVFVKNQLVIAVAHGNPKRITRLADLAGPGLKVALCAVAVPCGAAASKALAAAAVQLTPVTLEQDVRAALAKVRLGEVDAALVYRTDAKSAPTVDSIEFPESAGATNDYPIVALKNAPHPAAAAAFVAFVQTGPEMTVLTDAGFQKP